MEVPYSEKLSIVRKANLFKAYYKDSLLKDKNDEI